MLGVAKSVAPALQRPAMLLVRLSDLASAMIEYRGCCHLYIARFNEWKGVHRTQGAVRITADAATSSLSAATSITYLAAYNGQAIARRDCDKFLNCHTRAMRHVAAIQLAGRRTLMGHLGMATTRFPLTLFHGTSMQTVAPHCNRQRQSSERLRAQKLPPETKNARHYLRVQSRNRS